MTVRTVYLLCHKNSDLGSDVYVGSTTQTLAKRLACHKNDSLRIGNENNKLYKRMRVIGLENWVMRPLLSLGISCDEIRRFEKMWCEILRCDLNTYSPIQSAAERYEFVEKEWCATIKSKTAKGFSASCARSRFLRIKDLRHTSFLSLISLRFLIR